MLILTENLAKLNKNWVEIRSKTFKMRSDKSLKCQKSRVSKLILGIFAKILDIFGLNDAKIWEKMKNEPKINSDFE